MSDEIIAGLIGLTAGLIGAAIAYVATMRATKRQIAALERQAEIEQRERARERKERERDKIISVVSDLLTEHSAERVGHNSGHLDELGYKLERLVKSLHMQGDGNIAYDLSYKVGNYLEAVRRYSAGYLSGEELNEIRVRTREAIREAIIREIDW